MRVYLVDMFKKDTGNIAVSELSDEEFIAEAKRQGSVYTLSEFEDGYNQDKFSQETTYIRIRVT